METTKQHQKKQPKPRLDRRNAMKNINYDASMSPTSPSCSSSSSFDDHQFGGIRTYRRSLDVSPLSNQTSFRIQGDFDGEFDLICRSLGFSGPEDFAIPADAWEARNVLLSPSDNLHRARLRSVEALPKEEDVVLLSRFDGGVSSSSSNEVIELENGCVEFENCSNLVRESGENECVDLKLVVGVERTRNGGGGIKGVRPPYLAPPPVIVRAAVVDNVSSTWDICRSFGPDDGECSNSDGKFEEKEDIDEAVVEREEELDDDCLSSSTMVVTVYSISPNGKFRHNIESWQKGDFLGSGSFGTVYEGYTDNGLFFAVKEVSLLDQGSQGLQSIHQLEQEISLLSQFEHENIVQYLGTDKDEARLYIFLELVTKGSLASLYQKYNLRDSQVSAYTRQILNGLKYLHERNVVHRDIKCANILVDANGFVKLADFGLAKATKLNDVKSCKGTAFWMAPEVVNRKKNGYGLAADIWSLGCTVLEMLTRQIPYSHLEGIVGIEILLEPNTSILYDAWIWILGSIGLDIALIYRKYYPYTTALMLPENYYIVEMQALFRIGKGDPPPVPNSLSSDARDFIFKCLQVNPDNRPTAAQLLEHSFVKRSLQANSSPASPHYNLTRHRSG